jgi:hypothetical protein
MVTQKRTLGPTETCLLNHLAADGQIIFSTAQARAALGNEEQDVNKLPYQLTHKRWLLRLEKAKYLILPLEAGGVRRPGQSVDGELVAQPGKVAVESGYVFHAKPLGYGGQVGISGQDEPRGDVVAHSLLEGRWGRVPTNQLLGLNDGEGNGDH